METTDALKLAEGELDLMLRRSCAPKTLMTPEMLEQVQEAVRARPLAGD